MQSSRGQRGPPSSAPRPASASAPTTPPASPPLGLGAATWRLSAAFALLAAACVLVAAVPAPLVPEPHEHSFVVDSTPPFHAGAEAKGAVRDVGATTTHRASHDPLSSTSHASHHEPKLSVELEHEAARIRSAFTRLVDPTSPWLNILDMDARERSGGWISRWLGGGEGTLSVKMGEDDAHNISLPHRPAAFPDWLGPSSQLPVEGVLRPFTVLPPPKSKAQRDVGGGPSGGMRREDDITHPGESHDDAQHAGNLASSKRLEAGGQGEDDDERTQGKDETPERACVAPAWPPIRPSYPLPPFTIALIERGGCDFATKVLAAQERGAAAVVVGDSVAHAGETDEEGRTRENLITMFSPEDTTGIIIPSVFVSRASYLILRDLLSNHTVKGEPGLVVEIGEASDDGSALGSLLTFALLMPSLFLIATVAAHRVRVARQREANRAPPTVVLSLPERVWAPDIVWEKDDSESDKDERGDDDNASPKRKDSKAKSSPSAAEGQEVPGEVTESAPDPDSGLQLHVPNLLPNLLPA